jgi:NAD(P)-dependent dehydrogenase (short-subunit alcohol dehydrogenase family)
MISIINKTILVTGATDGIGKQTALDLARKGASVIIHGRDHVRVHAALDEIASFTGNDKLHTIVADFSSLQQVRSMADEICSKYERLDVLVNNAGILPMQRLLTADGFEMNFQVNHLAPFLLTNRFLDLLKKSAPARIVNVNSDTHAMCELDFDNLQAEKHFDWLNAYGLSKLGNMFMTYELADRLQGSGVVANCLHPGDIDTKMQRATSTVKGASTSMGAATSVYLSSSPEMETVSGKYFIDLKVTPSCEISYDIEKRKKFWEVSQELLKDFSS